MHRILIGTNNRGKVAEIRALMDGLGFELVLPADLGLSLQVDEDGSTYAENATKKAVAFAHASGLPALADDSGLEVDALGGNPGLHSHRFCPIPGASDADRRKYLLECLAGMPQPWTAHFHATVVIATPSGEVQIVNGQCEGEIIPDERGSQGFGYDPIFVFPALGRTMAELGMEEKNWLSHRGKAIRKAIPLLIEMCETLDG